MKKYTLAEIAEFLQAELRGDPKCIITSVASLDKAQEKQISFLGKVPGFVPSARQYLATTQAAAVILAPKDATNYSGNALLVDNPYVSYAKLTGLFNDVPQSAVGIKSSAVIGQDCNIHSSASIADNVTLGNNISVGKNTVIAAGCVIGDNATLGDDCHLYPNVTVYHRVKIGDRVIAHSGAVLGADGFGMANDKGVWCKIHQLGSVRVGNDVEIGANTCIDRGALDDTVIEDGVKLDNQIQIGHNVKIGAHTIMAGCTAVAGSTTIGKYCMIGGASILNGHINIADQTIITGGSGVEQSITKPGIYSSAVVVQPHRQWLRIKVLLTKLPDIVSKLRKLEEKIS